MLGHDGVWDHPDSEHDPQRYNNQIIEIAEYGYEIRHEIDGRQSLGGNKGGRQLGVPGYARVASR